MMIINKKITHSEIYNKTKIYLKRGNTIERLPSQKVIKHNSVSMHSYNIFNINTQRINGWSSNGPISNIITSDNDSLLAVIFAN